MAVANLAAYQAEILSPSEFVHLTKNQLAGSPARPSSLFITAPSAGSTPGAAAATDRTTAGAVGQRDGAGNPLHLGRILLSSANIGAYILYDRLSHTGGLDGTVITAQTTNLPTAALTRYTSGVGVMMALEIYTAVGTTATTVTVSYTNTASAAGQITPAVVFGAAGARETQRFVQLPLAAGDLGVKSVESVTVLASTLTAGSFGVTLYKPLAFIPYPMSSPIFLDWDAVFSGLCQMPEIVDGACLCWLGIPTSATNNIGPFQASLAFFEE